MSAPRRVSATGVRILIIPIGTKYPRCENPKNLVNCSNCRLRISRSKLASALSPPVPTAARKAPVPRSQDSDQNPNSCHPQSDKEKRSTETCCSVEARTSPAEACTVEIRTSLVKTRSISVETWTIQPTRTVYKVAPYHSR